MAAATIAIAPVPIPTPVSTGALSLSDSRAVHGVPSGAFSTLLLAESPNPSVTALVAAKMPAPTRKTYPTSDVDVDPAAEAVDGSMASAVSASVWPGDNAPLH